MKDETAGQPIKEFVGLRSKMYSMIYESKKKDGDETITEEKEKKRAKGVSHVVLEKEIKHSAYKDSLFAQTSSHHDMEFYQELFTPIV